MHRYHTGAITAIDNLELNQLQRTTYTSERWPEKLSEPENQEDEAIIKKIGRHHEGHEDV